MLCLRSPGISGSSRRLSELPLAGPKSRRCPPPLQQAFLTLPLVTSHQSVCHNKGLPEMALMSAQLCPGCLRTRGNSFLRLRRPSVASAHLSSLTCPPSHLALGSGHNTPQPLPESARAHVFTPVAVVTNYPKQSGSNHTGPPPPGAQSRVPNTGAGGLHSKHRQGRVPSGGPGIRFTPLLLQLRNAACVLSAGGPSLLPSSKPAAQHHPVSPAALGSHGHIFPL